MLDEVIPSSYVDDDENDCNSSPQGGRHRSKSSSNPLFHQLKKMSEEESDLPARKLTEDAQQLMIG